MNKTYHFLAGLPRSGNTLLSAILNQNPDIYCNSLSPLTNILYSYDYNLPNNENVFINMNKKNLDTVGNTITENYYKDINKPIIIDGQKSWGTPANLNLIKKYIVSKPKIIFTVRPIIDILTSFISILPDESYIDKEMRQKDWWYKNYLSKNDNRCDYLMRPWGQIDQTLFSINEIINNEETFCLIEYDKIISNSQETMDKIYKFLDLPSYEHNFNNIIKIDKHDDEEIGWPANMHEVRPILNKISKSPKEVLSDYVINKYSNMGWDTHKNVINFI